MKFKISIEVPIIVSLTVESGTVSEAFERARATDEGWDVEGFASEKFSELVVDAPLVGLEIDGRALTGREFASQSQEWGEEAYNPHERARR